MSVNGSVNVLSKVDRSLAPTPGGASVIKRTKFDWTPGGKVGEFSWIKKEELNIDGRYQRDQISEEKVREIARKWDWLLLGTVSVIQREDGTFWVFDGGHRTRAAFFRDDVECLPCMVHEIGEVSDEAKAFVARNTMVSNVSAIDRYRAAICAGEPTAVTTQNIMNELGLTAVKGGVTKGQYLACIGTLQKCVDTNAEDAMKVLEFCLSLAGEHLVSGKVLSAMFTLHQHYKSDFDVIDRFGEKISRHSQREIEVKIGQFSTECGKGGAIIGAKAILELINHKSRNRLQW